MSTDIDNFDTDDSLAEMLEAVMNASPSLPDPLAAEHVTDVSRVFVLTRLIADVVSRANHCAEVAPDDDAARRDLVAAYVSLRDAALVVMGDDYREAASRWGLPSCDGSATLAQVGNAAELASTFLNALVEVPGWVTAKRFEAASAKALTTTIGERDTSPSENMQPVRPTGQYL